MITHVDRNCFRGPRPHDLDALVNDCKIDTLIDLESGIYDVIHGVIRQFPADFGMAYYHMPCSDILPPKDEYVEKCLELMADGKRRVYVHCESGVDRTGFVCAVYRMRVQGWSYQEAKSEWIAMNRHPWYFYWNHALKKYERSK